MFLKPINLNDTTVKKTSLNETIPITGSILSGTYGTYPLDTNVKLYTGSHGLFESVYDYPYASSSANHIFDLTFGLRSGSLSSAPVTQSSEKYRMYNEMAQTLLGFDVTGNIRNFTLDGSTVSNKMLFVNFSRLLTKDGISIGTFSGSMGTGSSTTPFAGTRVDIKDNSTGITVDNVNFDSPVGQYWYIYTGSSYTTSDRVGMVFYQQGVAAFDMTKNPFSYISASANGTVRANADLYSTGTITEIADGFRKYTNNLQFLNTVQINSAIYACDVGTNEFNYSSNPTYTTASLIRVKANDPLGDSITYATTLGLYDANQNLIAVTKFSKPLINDGKGFRINVRLDY